MVQELIPKEKIKTPFSVNFLFGLSLILLIVLGGCYFGLKMKVSSIKSKTEEAENKIAKVKEEGDKEITKQVLDYGIKIKDFSGLFDKHKIVSHFFDFLEDSTHKKVWFSRVSLNTRTADVSLKGETESFKTLGEQILCLKENKFVKGLNLSNLSLKGEGGIQFDVNFSLGPEIFKNE